MNIISLISFFTNSFNKEFNNNIDFLDLESKIKNIGDDFTKQVYIQYLTYIDDEFAKSNFRKEKYTIKERPVKNIITSFGTITFKHRVYVERDTKKRYSFIKDILHLKPYQKITEQAEYQLIKYAMNENMSQAGKHAIRGEVIFRSTVSKKIAKLKGTIHEDIKKANTPRVLYIEMDEIHANLQIKGNNGDSKNHICPCAIVHEGHVDEISKRKKLKNVKNFASSKLSYRKLWDVIFDYVNKKYDINKIEYIFISGDGANGIKAYNDVFPNATFVLDPFHYKKWMKYIFKDDELLKIADSYIRERKIDDFKKLVKAECDNRPHQKDFIKQKEKSILNNIDGIINQRHEEYKCPCAMEGHVSNRYARYITSSPYAFSPNGLENKIKLLVLNADKHELTFEEFLTMKYGNNEYQEIIKHFENITSIKYKIKIKDDALLQNELAVHDIPIPKFDTKELTDRYNTLMSKHLIFN